MMILVREEFKETWRGLVGRFRESQLDSWSLVLES